MITRQPLENERGYSYELTEAGRDLDPIIMSLAVWGQKWSRDMEHEDLDPAFLAWSMHTRLNIAAMPERRTVMEFAFSGYQKSIFRFWLVVEHGQADMCLKYPGYESDIVVSADIRRFVETWRGFRDLSEEISSGHVRLEGPRSIKEAFPNWLLLSALSPFPRQVGKEAEIGERHSAVSV